MVEPVDERLERRLGLVGKPPRERLVNDRILDPRAPERALDPYAAAVQTVVGRIVAVRIVVGYTVAVCTVAGRNQLEGVGGECRPSAATATA